MRDVLVTGSSGRVGAVLTAGLGERVQAFDRPDDVLDADALDAALVGCRQVVHLAWDIPAENYDNGGSSPTNRLLATRVLEAAARAGVGRVVVAGSVHAGPVHPHARWTRPTVEAPTTPYGRSKVAVEHLGREAAGRLGLEVVGIRLGGVTPARDPKPAERGLWLSAEDCVSAFRSVLDAPLVPGRATVLYAVSRSRWRRHSTVNPFGWSPARR